MALQITDDCIVCDLCRTVCPNNAIAAGDDLYTIDPARCTECVGKHPVSQCVKVCSVRAVKPDPAYVESKEQLEEKSRRLAA